jgi:Ca2+-dependent lipid-binding protein
LTILKHKKLPKKGLFGKADPYVKVNLGSQNFKSPTIDNNLNPEWNYNVELKVAQDSSNIILLEVFDEDIGKDDAMGLVGIPVQEIVKAKKYTNQWKTLEKCKSGQVLISAEYIPTLQKEEGIRKATPVMMPKVISPQEQVEKPFAPIPAPRKSMSPEKITTDTPAKSEIISENTTTIIQDGQNISQQIEHEVVPVSKKIAMPAGCITLTVHRARDLEKKGILGKADPYFIVKHGTKTYQSHTVDNNHNPEWEYNVVLDSDETSFDDVKLEVFDEDFGKDDSMGMTTIEFEDIVVEGKIVNRWISLKNCKTGQVLISAEYTEKYLEQQEKKEQIKQSPTLSTIIPEISNGVQKKSTHIENTVLIEETTESKDFIVPQTTITKSEIIKEETVLQKSTEKQTSIITEETKEDKKSVVSQQTSIITSDMVPLPLGTISFKVHKAKKLQKKGMFGKADPYTVIKFGDKTFQSKTVKNSQNPEWSFDTLLDIYTNSPDSVSVEVFDEDIGKDDAMGVTMIDVKDIMNIKKVVNKWVPLEKCKSGDILVSAEYSQISTQEDIKDKPITITKSESTKSVEPEPKQKEILIKTQTPKLEEKHRLPEGIINFTVLKAKKLQKKGVFGKADPYTKITLGDQIHKSHTVKNNQNPEWNYNAKLNISKDSPDSILVEVFDEDVGKDDAMGIIQVDLQDIVESKKLVNKWVLLEQCKSGQVLISAEYMPAEKSHDTIQHKISSETVKL